MTERLLQTQDPAPAEEDTGQAGEASVTLPALIAIAVLSAGVGLFSPRLAMWTYALVLLVPALTRWRGADAAG